jgi:hypothetical protein
VLAHQGGTRSRWALAKGQDFLPPTYGRWQSIVVIHYPLVKPYFIIRHSVFDILRFFRSMAGV